MTTVQPGARLCLYSWGIFVCVQHIDQNQLLQDHIPTFNQVFERGATIKAHCLGEGNQITLGFKALALDYVDFLGDPHPFAKQGW